MKKKASVILLSLLICNFFVVNSMAHIVGPEIVEPTASGWEFKEDNPDVSNSRVNDLERASKPPDPMGKGVFFCGKKVYKNGTSFGWFGAIGLNGTFLFEREISTPYFKNATSCQYNSTSVIYVAGYGPQGCSIYKVNYSGDIYWNMSFGEAGDVLHQIAIIKIDGLPVSTSNGISAVGVKADGKRGFYYNINELNQSVNFNHSVGVDSSNEWDQVLAVATDPYLPNIVYLGGRKATSSSRPEKYDGFLIQFNIVNKSLEWERDLSTGSDTAIQAIQVEPIYGGVVSVGYMGDDALVYPLTFYNDEIWKLYEKPYFLWGGLSKDEATDVIILGESTFMIYITGTTGSYGWNKDCFVVKMNLYQEIQWEKLYGAMGVDLSATLTGEPAMSVFIGGCTDNKYIIVQNPAGNINIFAKFFGSDFNALLFVLITSSGAITIIIMAYLIVRRRKRGEEISTWVEDQKKQAVEKDQEKQAADEGKDA
ncbi:MAG: hypothetical protein ACFFCS_01575 [Candidatus Hodarchaeota archaeon]